MPLFSSKSKKLKAQLEEAERQQARQEEELRQQQDAYRRREREWQVQREREEYQRRESERIKEEQAQLEREIAQQRQEQERLREKERANKQMARLRQTTPEALRRLRDLIRQRYQLDMYIWSLRGVRAADQQLVINEGKKSDAVLQEIMNIVDTWEKDSWSSEEWKLAERIRDSIIKNDKGEKRIWEGNPPWYETGYRN